MTEIQLTNSPLKMLVDDSDADLVGRYDWRLHSKGYAVAKRMLLAHRLLMGAQSGQMIDHRNGNKMDNRRANLRLANCSENNRNVGKACDNRSGYVGVTWAALNEKWRARIRHNGKYISLGLFNDPEDAATVYNFAADELFGDFAVMNEPLAPESWASDAAMQQYDYGRYANV